jgi:ABC-type methionine transport system ATPase subunit
MVKRRLKLVFSKELVKEPIIYELGKKFEVVTNIRRADVSHDQGWVILEVSGEELEVNNGIDYLRNRGVIVENAEGNMVE